MKMAESSRTRLEVPSGEKTTSNKAVIVSADVKGRTQITASSREDKFGSS